MRQSKYMKDVNNNSGLDSFLEKTSMNTDILEKYIWNSLIYMYNKRRNGEFKVSSKDEVNIQMQIINADLVSIKNEGRNIAIKHNNDQINDVIAFYVPNGNSLVSEPFYLSRLVNKLRKEKVYFINCTSNGSLFKFSIRTKDLINTLDTDTNLLTLKKK